MSENIYALSGSFAMKPGLQKGLTIYRYDLENGGFQYIGRCLEDINMGQQCPGPFDNVIISQMNAGTEMEWRVKEGKYWR